MEGYLNGLIGSINRQKGLWKGIWMDWLVQSTTKGFMEGYLNGLIGSINRQKGLQLISINK
jgi:hypothetical protein